MTRIALAGLPLLALAACAQPMPPPPAQVRVVEVFRASQTALGQPLRFPGRDGTVVVTTYDIPPGAKLPVHRHRQQRMAYVLAGNLRVSTPEGRFWDYKAGDMVIEMLDGWHSGQTLGNEPVRLLVIDQTEGNSSNTELHP